MEEMAPRLSMHNGHIHLSFIHILWERNVQDIRQTVGDVPRVLYALPYTVQYISERDGI